MSEARPKGYISKQFTVWCGLCNKWDQASAPRNKVFVAEIKAAGWRSYSHFGWVCPACRTKLNLK
jgi:hypothetical protein